MKKGVIWIKNRFKLLKENKGEKRLNKKKGNPYAIIEIGRGVSEL